MLAEIRAKPALDFLIIGAAKSSTTWLQASLQQASDIFMPDPELHFFSREFERGFPWYAEHFPQQHAGTLIGEKSNSYLSDPQAAERIRDAYPDIRLVALLRNPVARAYSDYCMLYRRGDVHERIEEYLDPSRATFRRFIDDGLYAAQLTRFLDRFPKEALLVMFFEDMRASPQQELDRLARHLGKSDGSLLPHAGKVKDSKAAMVPKRLRELLKPIRPILDPIRNTGPIQKVRGLVAREVQYPPLTDVLAEGLRAYYAEDVRALEGICKRQLGDWLATPVRRG
ncbi:MAG: sulfotransferase [Dinoroseobacter sp.]|nr:sulfotransferase [Dinoroseobacter sp.]